MRIIAATNRDLHQAVQEGTFREDLFQRLSVFPLVVPPLRQRREDIPRLAAHFVRQCAHKCQRPMPSVSDEALAYLQAHRWPGNVRQLAHWVERMVILSEGERLEMADVLEAEEMEQALASWASVPPLQRRGRRRRSRRWPRATMKSSASSQHFARPIGSSPGSGGRRTYWA